MPSDDVRSTQVASDCATPVDETRVSDPSRAREDAPLPGSEVIPGYTLVTRLGRGGFGEVWRAIGPGEVPVALKLLRFDGSFAEVEARALDFMKRIVHPHLLTTFGIWHRADLLFIGMELADETLLDRLRRAVAEGQPGIPFGELLESMREAAKGIDFLNEPRHIVGGVKGVGITHRDIKPQNLLLVGGGVKVADFGLARVAERTATTNAGGLTPAYAAPEFFQGHFHRQSDQYSLAVSYCQLRCNRLPFEGHPLQVMAGHIQGTPDLTFLPEAEKGVVARALSRHADERWPNNRAFVQQLAEIGGGSPKVDAPKSDVLIYTYPLLGEDGSVTPIPCTPHTPVWSFLDDVFFLICSKVDEHSYGKRWMLRDPLTSRIFDVGTPWAKSNQVSRDERLLSAVGIRLGMTLEVLPLHR